MCCDPVAYRVSASLRTESILLWDAIMLLIFMTQKLVREYGTLISFFVVMQKLTKRNTP